jgi:hypothetical protein
VEWLSRRSQLGPRDAHVVKRRRMEQLIPLPPSIRTLWTLLDLIRGATTSG